MTHEIKILDAYADAVLSGDKTFEIRKNDRGYQKGDMIRFNVVDDLGLHEDSELSKHTYRITYVLSGWGISEGYVALGIRREEDGQKPPKVPRWKTARKQEDFKEIYKEFCRICTNTCCDSCRLGKPITSECLFTYLSELVDAESEADDG